MKNIGESGEVMGYYAQIDFCYLMIEQISAELNKPLKPIEVLVDRQTGYGEYKNEKAKKETIDLLKCIIKCKKKIEADYSRDEKFLNKLKSMP